MYNADGSLRATTRHKYSGGNNGNSVHDTNFGNGQVCNATTFHDACKQYSTFKAGTAARLQALLISQRILQIWAEFQVFK